MKPSLICTESETNLPREIKREPEIDPDKASICGKWQSEMFFSSYHENNHAFMHNHSLMNIC